MKEQSSSPEEQPLKESVIFLLYRDGMILAERGLTNDGFRGLLVIPGGHVEPEDSDESGAPPDTALRRELSEELGITPLNYKHLFSFDNLTPNRNLYLTHVYLVEDWEGEI